MTIIDCPLPGLSQEDRVNCTITTRDGAGEPAAGAMIEALRVYHAPELSDPSPVQGGPIHWYVHFATCQAGRHNVTVEYAGTGFNATAQAVVVASYASNFTLDCTRGRAEVVAGERVPCDITTVDKCGNPTSVPPVNGAGAAWSVARFGAALDNGDVVAPILDAATLAEQQQQHLLLQAAGTPAAASALVASAGGSIGAPPGLSLAATTPTARYEAAFRVQTYYVEGMNYTERGTAGLSVTLTTANWTEQRESLVRIRPAALAAGRTTVTCLPETGLLEGHVATCRARTFDAYDNPQVGARGSDFAVTYLSNPAAYLGTTDGGFMTPTDRGDTFETSFRAVEEGSAGIRVSVNFQERVPSGTPSAATVLGTLIVKRSELVLFPTSAVMSVAVPFTVSLDASGAVHRFVVVRFIKGGQQVSGRLGGCLGASMGGELGFDAYTSAGTQLIPYTFREPGDYVREPLLHGDRDRGEGQGGGRGLTERRRRRRRAHILLAAHTSCSPRTHPNSSPSLSLFHDGRALPSPSTLTRPVCAPPTCVPTLCPRTNLVSTHRASATS